MDQETAGLATAIGARVRAERQARHWTLDRLAEAAGVSRRMVINVEQGTANPSVGTLLRLSEALGIGLPALVEPPVTTPIRRTAPGQGAVLWTGENGGRAVLLTSAEPPDVVELWTWTLAPADSHSSEPHSPGTRELLHVQQGSIELSVGEQSLLLAAGESVSFHGDIAHAYANHTREPAQFVLTVFEPGAGSPSPTGTSHA